MVIYGEYLFIENMITGWLILFFTAKILGERIRVLPMGFCGICCGLYAFILFSDIRGLASLVGKFLFSMAMVFLAFGKASPKRIVQNAGIFLSVTVLYGGIAIALLTSFGWTGVTATSGVYLPPLSYMTITAVATCSAWLLSILISLLKVKRIESRVIVDASLSLCKRKWQLKGLIDSGNTLKEPLTGKPVCIVRRALMEELLTYMEQPASRYTVIPYHGVGVEKNLLEGYRMDELSVRGKILKSPILAICEEKYFFKDAEDLQILLPGMMLERGINGDYSEV